MTSLMSLSMLAWSRVLQGRASAEPPASVISRATVLIVDAWEFGFGGNSDAGMADASEVVLADTTTETWHSQQACNIYCRV